MAACSVVKLLGKKHQMLQILPFSVSSCRYFGKPTIPKPVFEERKRKYREQLLAPMEETPTLEQRLKEINENPMDELQVDISLPSNDVHKLSRVERLQWRREQRDNKEWEKLARLNKLKINMSKLEEDWQRTVGPLQVQEIADHFGIYEHLFEHAYFTPWVPLQVLYDHNEEYVNPIYHGNILPASEVVCEPHVTFSSKPDDLWTLVLTNLDGHLLNTECEYLHWFVGNIKGGDLSSGETVCDYMQPFPWRGTGYHRLVFVLYKQDQHIDFSSIKRSLPCHCLKERTFRSFDFYKAHQDILTPAGLSFYQCTWDTNLTSFIHDVLQMREPVFEYNEPPIWHAEQVVVPHRKPFNIYLDRYRDPKEIKKEVLLKRLKMVHPFKEEPPMPKYPNLQVTEGRFFSWQEIDRLNERLRLGKFRDLRPHSAYPQEDSQGNYKYPS